MCIDTQDSAREEGVNFASTLRDTLENLNNMTRSQKTAFVEGAKSRSPKINAAVESLAGVS